MACVSVLAVLGAADGRTGPGWGPSTPKTRASADRILTAKSRDINRASVGETHVATFLGAEFGMSEQEIIEEKRALGASWGNFTIAHTLATSDKQGMTVAQVAEDFPSLTESQIRAARTYARAHPPQGVSYPRESLKRLLRDSGFAKVERELEKAQRKPK